MAIFQEQEETILRIFWCPKCQSYWREGRRDVGCLVNHAPGTCCHYTDIPLTKEQVDKFLKI